MNCGGRGPQRRLLADSIAKRLAEPELVAIRHPAEWPPDGCRMAAGSTRILAESPEWGCVAPLSEWSRVMFHCAITSMRYYVLHIVGVRRATVMSLLGPDHLETRSTRFGESCNIQCTQAQLPRGRSILRVIEQLVLALVAAPRAVAEHVFELDESGEPAPQRTVAPAELFPQLALREAHCFARCLLTAQPAW